MISSNIFSRVFLDDDDDNDDNDDNDNNDNNDNDDNGNKMLVMITSYLDLQPSIS
jgi:hypothetical protein